MDIKLDMRNLGYFRIRSGTIINNIEEVIEVFSLLKLVPLKVEYRPDIDAYEYLAISERFPRVPANSIAPEYEFKIKRSEEEDDNTIVSVDIIKV